MTFVCRCGKVVGHLLEKYDQETKQKNTNEGTALTKIGLETERMCCRAFVLTHAGELESHIVKSNNTAQTYQRVRAQQIQHVTAIS